MTILGLSKVWLISIFAAVVVVSAAAIITVVTTSIVVMSADSDVPDQQDQDQQDQDQQDQDPLPDDNPFKLIFIKKIQVTSLCQGAYTTQSTMVNSGDLPVTDASLASEVIEGADLVDNVDISSPSLGDALAFNSIAANQKVDLDIKVKVKDNWWKKPNGTKIKVKLSVKSKGGSKGGSKGPSQIITIVNESAQFITLTGVAHDNGDGNLLIDGTVITMDDCTGLPSTIVVGAFVKVIGLLGPDGRFTAINIFIINNTTVIGEFDSGVPLPGPDGDNGDGNSGGGGGGGKGGSKKGGSKGK